MRKADIDRVVAQLRSAEAAYEEARRQRDEAVIKMARVDGLNNREIAARVELTCGSGLTVTKVGQKVASVSLNIKSFCPPL